MAQLEDLTVGATVSGILLNQPVTIVATQECGPEAIELIYKDPTTGHTGNLLIFRDDAASLDIVTHGQPWSFEGDGDVLRLVSEAHRIRLAYLFDPLLAVHTSVVEPLPHQITAVYGEMLGRQPLRFLLADDPGAGKTIMAGLLIRELLLRGDLQRCLIVCPGSLALQWQDELFQKFHLPFEILTNDRLEAARTGNGFAETPFGIARLDKLSRDRDLHAKLAATDWDLVVMDEAHKLSAAVVGGEVRETQRHKLGKLLSGLTRHFLLMTATPHNGKEEDFQLFLGLLDGDRFEGCFRSGAKTGDASDLMRRLVKEDLLKFDGKPLFPERRARTVQYQLSDLEALLYKQVTDYVRDEFDRADQLLSDGRRGTIGFALTILQRRLASSPEAIYQSLRRRRDRLQKRLREEASMKRGLDAELGFGPMIDPEDWDDDFEDASGTEREATEEEVVDRATAARTVAELQAEIDRLRELEQLALRVRRSGKDRKWDELSRVIQEVFLTRGNPSPAAGLATDGADEPRSARKLVIFTEHRDTLNYLSDRIRTLLGRPEAIVTIHGSIGRDDRKRAENAFKQDPAVEVLIATDAAGEGINLQRAHLMVNYDLPWNPNRLEQRFGRIHRIGQTEVCHLWNLVAAETREGDVYLALLKKLEIEQAALGGKVFDVLGKAIAGKELRELLIEAIRYGERPDVKAKLDQVVDRLDHDRLRELLEERALARDSMDMSQVQQIRADMERAAAQRLQPYFVSAFFLEAFQQLGGSIREREPRRYEISHVPSVIRNRDRAIGQGRLLRRYERICFEKPLMKPVGKPDADLICPGHPLLDATLDVILERHRSTLQQGAILVDDNDPSETARILVYLDHAIQDGCVDAAGQRRIVSRRMQYVEIPLCAACLAGHCTSDRHEENEGHSMGYAPYLDYRSIAPDERPLLTPLLDRLGSRQDLEQRARNYAIKHLVSQHWQEVRDRTEQTIDRILQAVRERLTQEILYWDDRANQLDEQEKAGKPNARLNSAKARERADELTARLSKRTEELEQERKLSMLPPTIVSGSLIIPIGLLQRLQGKRDSGPSTFARETRRVELAAMEAVMAAERAAGRDPQDVSAQKCGYDICSIDPATGQEYLIEVKGRIAGATTVTVTRNEITIGLNSRNYWLALVQVPIEPSFAEGDAFRVRERSAAYHVGHGGCVVRYVHRPFEREPDWAATSINYDWRKLWERGSEPRRHREHQDGVE